MSTNDKSIINLKSSEKLQMFLDKMSLHKRDFAEMVGVTLSYVYNLIDNAIPFSTRTTTLERIATVMDVEPEEFEEYKIQQEPLIIDEGTAFIKNRMREKHLPTSQFLKSFPRKKRVEIVDILRGAKPIPLDWKELCTIAQILDIPKEEIYPFWESRLKQLMQNAGMNLQSNLPMINAIFKCARDHVYS